MAKQYLYKVAFNDFGSDYAVAESFDAAVLKVVTFYGDETKVKKIELVGEVADKLDGPAIRIHL